MDILEEVDKLVVGILTLFVDKREVTRFKKFFTAIILFCLGSYAIFGFKEGIYEPTKEWVADFMYAITGNNQLGALTLLIVSSLIIIYHYKQKLPYT
jgi:formate hydrogenlyase subunit 3/multisubunit Na+/H+ antiporter MnhD subunit